MPFEAFEREWFDRVVEERDELQKKIDTLSEFLADKRKSRLMQPEELVSLQMQESYMKLYLAVLNERIERNKDGLK